VYKRQIAKREELPKQIQKISIIVLLRLKKKI